MWFLGSLPGLLLYLLLTTYVGYNLFVYVTSFPISPIFRARLRPQRFILVFVLFSVILVALRFLDLSTPTNVLVYFYFVAFLYAIFLLPLVNLLIFLRHRLRSLKNITTLTVTSAGTSLIMIIGLIIAIGTYNAFLPVVRSYEVSIDKSIKGLSTSQSGSKNSLRVVMASDMHFGAVSDKAHAQRMVDLINSQEPDLVLFPGDIVDDVVTEYNAQRMYEDLARINAPLGVYASLGNHEYYGRQIPEFIQTMKRSNVDVLMDVAVDIGGLYILGREDYKNKNRKTIEELTARLDHSKPIISLDHQPRELDLSSAAGVDLMLSGHTHKAQLFPLNFITSYMYENDYGYLLKGSMHQITSSGYGFWGPPVRIGSRSEIVVVDIAFSSKK